MLGLRQWSLGQANRIPLSQSGCGLLPDMTVPDSTWVKVHKGFFPVGAQARVYLPSLRKFSFLWVGGTGRGEAGVSVGLYGLFWGRKQGVPKIKSHGRVPTCPPIHPFILCYYHMTGSEAIQMIRGSGTWEIINIYWINDLNLCISFTLITTSHGRTVCTFRIRHYLAYCSPQLPEASQPTQEGYSSIFPTFLDLHPKFPHF